MNPDGNSRGNFATSLWQPESHAFPSSSESRPIPSYQNCVVRKLLNETHGIFHKLQNWVEANEQLGAEELTRISCEYRSSLRSACISLQDQTDSSETRNLLDLYRSAEIIWSLAELLFIRPPGGSLALDLTDWGCWNFTQADQWASDILTLASDDSCRPEEHENFWNTMYLYTLFGRCTEASKLLQTHSRKLEGGFRSIDELLRKIPLFSIGIDQNSEWNQWQTEARRRLRDGHYTAYPELELIAKILCGEDSTLKELRSLFSSWYEALIPIFLYRHSEAKLFDLQDIVEEAFSAVDQQKSSSLRPLDSILLALMELDILWALKELSTQTADWWLPAHLADLLFHAGCKDLRIDSVGLLVRRAIISSSATTTKQKEEERQSITLREYLVLEFARGLMEHSSLWQLGVAYLDGCPSRGAKVLHSLLEKMIIDSDHKAMKILKVAEDRGMTEVSKGLCRQMGLKALQNSNLGVALGWCLHSKDGNFATFMAEKCLDEYGRTGLLHGLNLLDQVGDTAVLSPSLIFLGKYKEFHRLYQEGNMKEAGNLLCRLLESKVAPRKFWITLMLDALPMLDLQEGVIFDKDQTYQLIEIIETISNEREFVKSEEFASSDAEKESLELQMKRFKLSLVRNLAKAIVE